MKAVKAMQLIRGDQDREQLLAAAQGFRAAEKRVALSGAGISVGSGIPDFRSKGGLWSVFPPEEYATLEVFLTNPAKAWELFRALGKVLLGKQPNPAHRALAQLEETGLLQGVVTQNVDNLHQQAGNRRVLEIHGDHQHLACLHCGHQEAVRKEHYRQSRVPLCCRCGFPLKPKVVLFGEAVRKIEEIDALIADCDLLLVLGTSAQVYPAAGLPGEVRRNQGRIYSFNQDPPSLEPAGSHDQGKGDYYFQGDLSATLPLFVKTVLRLNP